MVNDPAQYAAQVAQAPTWDGRVALLRNAPQHFGIAALQTVYRTVAREVYVPHIAPDFAYIHFRDEYSYEDFEQSYDAAYVSTEGFTQVSRDELVAALHQAPQGLRTFRELLGLTRAEFAACTRIIAEAVGLPSVTANRVESMERGGLPPAAAAQVCAEVIDRAMAGTLFAAPEGDLHSKMEKADTLGGWDTVRRFAEDGVPYSLFLHQRLIGSTWGQLLNATSALRGNLLEDAVQDLFQRNGVQFVRTGAHNQQDILNRFHLTVTPAPDFVVFSGNDVLRAMLECKGTNDGGTSRDKAARFENLHQEGTRLGGVPVFAVLGGLGWTRVGDALAPVVEHSDGRVFFLPTLEEMMTVQPFPDLVHRPANVHA